MEGGPSETRLGSSPSRPISLAGLTPGTVLADRYRIVALLGRGGMGEVYRADDLRLGQPVALKFLPRDLEDNAFARERLLAAVRSARTVSHPNVCRVFGLAADVAGAGAGMPGAPRGVVEVAGTLAYMAPERFSGAPSTVQGDLYALGLVLYEVYTGKQAVSATTIEAWQLAHTNSTPSSPSTLVSEIEPVVERAILRCLEKDPAKRPSSAAQLAAALPVRRRSSRAMTATATATNMIDSGTSSTSRRRPATKRASPSQGAVVVVRGRAREARKAWHQDAQRKGVNAPDQHTDEHRSADERIAPASVQQARPADEQVRPAASNRRARTPGTSATQ